MKSEELYPYIGQNQPNICQISVLQNGQGFGLRGETASQQMNGTDGHTLNLAAGDVLQVTFETQKGSLHMELTTPDGTQ